jgi:hypothetical protein
VFFRKRTEFTLLFIFYSRPGRVYLAPTKAAFAECETAIMNNNMNTSYIMLILCRKTEVTGTALSGKQYRTWNLRAFDRKEAGTGPLQKQN